MARTGGKKPLSPTQRRKQEHLELCLDPSVEGSGTGFDRYAFVHNALPETDLDEIDLSTTFLGKRLKAPVLISSMTGGFELPRSSSASPWASARSASRWSCPRRQTPSRSAISRPTFSCSATSGPCSSTTATASPSAAAPDRKSVV